jgi:hypothetical protein
LLGGFCLFEDFAAAKVIRIANTSAAFRMLLCSRRCPSRTTFRRPFKHKPALVVSLIATTRQLLTNTGVAYYSPYRHAPVHNFFLDGHRE